MNNIPTGWLIATSSWNTSFLVSLGVLLAAGLYWGFMKRRNRGRVSAIPAPASPQSKQPPATPQPQTDLNADAAASPWWTGERSSPATRTVLVLVMMILLYWSVYNMTWSVANTALSFLENVISYVLRHEFGQPTLWTLYGKGTANAACALIVTVWFVRKTYRIFMVKVPEFVLLLLVNAFGGNFRRVKTGLNLKFPWEEVRDDLWILMEVVAVTFNLTCPTKDGGEVTVSGIYRYKPSEAEGKVETYASINEDSIGDALVGGAMAEMTRVIGGMETSKVAESLKAIKDALDSIHGDLKHDSKDEKTLGVDFIDITVSKIEFANRTRKTLDILFEAETLFKDKDADQRSDILAMGDHITKNMDIKEIKLTLNGLKDLPPEIVQALSTAGPALAAYFGASAGNQRTKQHKQGQQQGGHSKGGQKPAQGGGS